MDKIEEKKRGNSAAMPSSSSDHPAVVIPRWWEEAADSIAYDSPSDPPPVAVVCGPGNSGKSTFSRILLDALLKRYKRVGYLDTDVGQPEFTTPGCLSLHIIDKPMPDLTVLCLKTPERCFFYGDVNCQKDKNVYLNDILCLYDYFRKEYYRCREGDGISRRIMLPLIVNTSGWVKGAGYGLLVEMLMYISPTHVVQIRVSAESKNLPKGMFWLDENQKGSANVIEVCAAPKESSCQLSSLLTRKDARMLRDIRIIAYFRQCLPRDLGITTYKQLAHSLASIPAYKMHLSKLTVIQLHSQDSSTDISQSLNREIVGLGVSSFVPASRENPMPWCLGLGFVRALDVSKDALYVITPVSTRSLERVDLILRGCIEVPPCLLQAPRSESACISTNALHKLEAQEMGAQMARA